MSIINLIENNVLKSPTAIAVIENGKKYSYEDIWDRSADIAHCLISDKVKHNDIVGLNFEKSADYIIAILGVWRAGKAFAPLPNNQPKSRIEKFCKLAGIETIISKIPKAKIIKNITYENTDSDLAYVFFTSGSTGEPKAVAIEHRGLIPLIKSQIPAFDLCSNKRVLLFLDISFDASLSDILTCLCSGATLVIETSIFDVKSIELALRKSRITTFDVPPSMLALLDIDNMPDCLDTIIVGGEPSPAKLLSRWAERYRVISVYGPTETTICSSLQKVDPQTWTMPMIGQPIMGTRFSIRDENGVITDSEGELWISGLGVARGYLNRSDITELKFVIDNNVRWYLTGDRVVKRDDNYIFIGRTDRQLKLRGKLISPEEVESSLLTIPLVKQAVVTLEKSYLTAYLVGRQVNIHELVKHLLPSWMIPSRVYWVDELPRLKSGKVNFSSLPNIRNNSFNSSLIDYKSLLIKLFSEILEIDEVGLDDNFFHLGGDSISVMSLIVSVESFGYSISAEDVYSKPTIRQLIVDTISQGRDFEELIADSHWSPKFQPEFRETDSETIDYFITGATGFLGIEVIIQLLKQTEANIHCLVRSTSQQHALDRIDSLLLSRKIPYDKNRLFVYDGDIIEELMGLSHELYSRLSDCVNTVIHCAAEVNMMLSYDALYETNIIGTKIILDFASDTLPKKVWYASTLSVFVSAEPLPAICFEADDLSNTKTVYGGYAQTKWVSEIMMRSAVSSLPNIQIARFGLLVGDFENGIVPKNDLFAFFIHAVNLVKSIPKEIMPLLMDLTPVSYAAQVMVSAFLNDTKIIHIANPLPVSGKMLIDAFIKYDPEIEITSLQSWLNSLSQHEMTKETSAAILGVTHSLRTEGSSRSGVGLFAATATKFDQTNLIKTVNKVCPEPTIDSLQKIIANTLGRIN